MNRTTVARRLTKEWPSGATPPKLAAERAGAARGDDLLFGLPSVSLANGWCSLGEGASALHKIGAAPIQRAKQCTTSP